MGPGAVTGGWPLGKFSMTRFSLWVSIRVQDNRLRFIPVHTGNPKQFAQPLFRKPPLW